MAHRLVRDNYSTTKRFLKDFFTTLLGGTGGFGVDDREWEVSIGDLRLVSEFF